MVINDATAVADVLNKKYGFKTTLLLNANRYQILSVLSTLRGQLTEKDNLLIYYEVTDTLNVMSAKHVLVIADSCCSGALTRSSVTRLEAGMSWGAKINWFRTMTKKRSRMVLTSGGLEPVLEQGEAIIRCSPRPCLRCLMPIARSSKGDVCIARWLHGSLMRLAGFR
jgi:hypothetical protein